MSRLAVTTSVALALWFGAAGASRAEDLLFTLSGADSATFSLSSNPQVQSTDQFSIGFGPVTGMFNGVATTFSDLRFGDFVYAPALELGGPNDYYGPQIFSGSDAAPVFSPGVFNLNGGDGPETLVVSAVSAAPEPQTWALMVVGLFTLGFGLRRHKAHAPPALA